MLRCRRCRKGLVDSTCLSLVGDSDEGSAAVCSIWHVNVDTLPEWILTSVNQAQWTVGKLKCHNCGARLGGFNFVNHFQCPCGRDASVHLNKSRVDHDQKRRVLIVQPRRTRPERVGPGLLADYDSRGTPQDSLQLNCAALMSHGGPADASGSLSDGDHAASFTFSPLYCLSHRRRCSVEDDADFGSSCFCPAGSADTSAVDSLRSGPDGPSWSPLSSPARRQLETDDGGSFDIVPRWSVASVGPRSHLDQQLLQEDVAASVAPDVREEMSESAAFLRRRSASDRVAEPEDATVPAAPVETSSRLSKREKNRLKNLRRKQRRRERWLHSQLEQAECASGGLQDSEEEEEEEEREGLTCAVCLDVYFSPYSCQPCGHVFCEPCLRTLAKNRPSNTPCPLCRTFISHTSFHKELNHTVKSFFPKVFLSRKQNFHNSSCAKWPLPSFRKRFRSFWGYQHRPGAAGRRRWHFGHGGFTLEALDLADMRGWLFDIGLVIVYIHSLNWILALLLLGLFSYYFFF